MKAIIRRLYEGHHAIEIQLFKQRCPSRSPRYNLNRPRAPAYQSHNPFPFPKHPGELRNGVYKLVSSSTDWLYCGGPKLPVKGHTEGISCYRGSLATPVSRTLWFIRACTVPARRNVSKAGYFFIIFSTSFFLSNMAAVYSPSFSGLGTLERFLPALGPSRQERDLFRRWNYRRVHTCDEMFPTELPLDILQVQHLTSSDLTTPHIILNLQHHTSS